MDKITITGTVKNHDGTIPQGAVIKTTLITKNFFSDTDLVPTGEQSHAIDNETGAVSIDLAVPDDAEQAARYHVRLPDSTSFYASVSANSPTDLETFINTATDAETYDPSTLDAYLPLAGGKTMTGAFVLSGAPTADLHPATKKYVDDSAIAAGDVTSIVALTQAAYDALTPDANTLYLITD